MKKIFTLIAITAGAFVSQAQTDLKIEFTNYSNGEVFANDTIKTEFKITNNGMTMFHTGDTLYVNAKINGVLQSLDLMSSAASPIVLTSMLHNGQSTTYNPGYLLGSQTLPFFPGSQTLDFCLILWGKGMASVGTDFGGDVDTTNNLACATFDPSATGIDAVSTTESGINLFPNPATEQINFNSLTQVAISTIKIMDINGKTIDNLDNIGNTKAIVTLNSLNNGVYFYQVHLKNGRTIFGKFSVCH
jgi:hypothetical protein